MKWVGFILHQRPWSMISVVLACNFTSIVSYKQFGITVSITDVSRENRLEIRPWNVNVTGILSSDCNMKKSINLPDGNEPKNWMGALRMEVNIPSCIRLQELSAALKKRKFLTREAVSKLPSSPANTKI